MSHLSDDTAMGRLYLKALRIKYRQLPGLWVPIMWHLALRRHTDAMIDLADWFLEGDSSRAFGFPRDGFSAAGLCEHTAVATPVRRETLQSPVSIETI